MSTPSRIVRFADCELDLDAFELRRAGQPVAVEPQVFELLSYLARHHGRLVGKDELIEQVWGGRNVSDAALSSRIRSVRRAIGDDGEQQHLIRTVHGRGFRFVATIGDDGGAAAAEAPAPPAGAVPAAPLALPWRLGRRIRARPVAASAVAAGLSVVLVASAALGWRLWYAPPVPPRLSIVVLPFANHSGGAVPEYVADTLVEGITARLSRQPEMFVISHGTARTYKDRSIDQRVVGHELEVRYVASGSLRHGDDGTAVAVQLAEAERGAQLWAETVVYGRAELISAQDQIAAGIARALGIEMVSAESERSRRERPDNPDALDLAMRGRALHLGRVTPEVNRQALELFEAAVALDADCVWGLIGIARAHLSHVLNEWKPRDDRAARLDRAEQAINRAIALAPMDSFAQRTRGALLRARGDPEQAIAAFERAIAINPNDSFARAELGRTMIDVGQAAQGLMQIERAMRLSPRDRLIGVWYFWAGQAAVHAGDGKVASKWLRKAIEDNPAYLNPLPWLAVALAFNGREDEARPYMDEYLRRRPHWRLANWDSAYERRHPVVLVQRERIVTALRRLGVPE